jgi:DNA (cytosine-5)-methyltransferase 1
MKMNEPIVFGSVCSGIEAASVAWNPLGWHAAWLSEIEPFPCALLRHHYPDVPNLGDMREIPRLLRSGLIYPPDVFCGGTPCQAFSLAGLRQSLDDARGNLSLTFCEIANEIDIQRAANGLLPCVVFWENVPGVLSTKDNAFGHFLAGLAGEDDPLVAPGKKWPDAGCVYGPQRTVAWRVQDAQYFGLAQRRRRVFVVASARNGFDPAAVLFEFEGVRRDSAPRREAWQDTAGTLAARTDGGGFPGTDEACSGYVQPVAAVQVCPTLRAGGNSTGGDRPPGTDVDTADSLVVMRPIAFDSRQECISSTEVFGALGSSSPQAQAVCVTGDITHTLKAEGFDASEDGTGRGQPIVAAYANTGHFGGMREVDISDPLRAKGGDTGNGGESLALHNTAVRRLTPRECERLQGFQWRCDPSYPGAWQDADGSWWSPDYTLIPMPGRRATPRGERRTDLRMAADGPRYKALGNSWAVKNVRWIGQRIDAQLRALDRRKT